jgi:hypothetical protein
MADKCEKCGGTQLVGTFAANLSEGMMGFPICEWCYIDKEGFQDWLEVEIEKALADSAEWAKTSDGKWTRTEQMPI